MKKDLLVSQFTFNYYYFKAEETFYKDTYPRSINKMELLLLGLEGASMLGSSDSSLCGAHFANDQTACSLVSHSNHPHASYGILLFVLMPGGSS